MKESELRKETYRILKTLAEQKSFRSAKKRLPGLTDREIWKAISVAASMLRSLPGVEKHRNLKVYIDGAAAPNPGPSGIGVVIYDQRKKKIKEVKKYIGLGSNNVAEYKALIRGLKESKKLLAQSVNVFSDSELLVNQMNGRFRINDKHLMRLSEQAKTLEGKFEKVTYRLIGRNENRLTDQLANIAIKNSYK
ncbi:MAG: ribonuclease HI family protein [bacterium]